MQKCWKFWQHGLRFSNEVAVTKMFLIAEITNCFNSNNSLANFSNRWDEFSQPRINVHKASER